MNTTPDKLTETELETLATMIDSGNRHMARATDPVTHQLPWSNETLVAAVSEACDGFYDIQNRHARNSHVYI